jgi:hypothetical protein
VSTTTEIVRNLTDQEIEDLEKRYHGSRKQDPSRSRKAIRTSSQNTGDKR